MMDAAVGENWSFATPNNGMQLTKAARCAPFSLRSWGQSLRAAFAADPECSAGDCESDDDSPSSALPVQ